MIKIVAFFIGLMFFVSPGFSQDVEDVTVTNAPGYKSASEQNQDKSSCATYADSQFERKNKRTLKHTGIGAGIGAVVGKIVGKTVVGAGAGGAAGAYHGHRKNKKEERAFNETYASCLREKGYSVEVNEN